jgi:long-chain-fatty-acyl-CoA reductase
MTCEKTVELPIVVCGKTVWPRDRSNQIELRYNTGLRALLPELAPSDIETIVQNREALHQLSLAEVADYLAKGAKKWVEKDFALREDGIALGSEITGYSREMLIRDYAIIGFHLMNRHTFFDLVEAELGSNRILDEWVTRLVCKVRAYPRGRVLHMMVGNVPMVGVYSIARSVITRNHTWVKLPARDPVTSVAFLRTLIAANGEDHPLSRSLSAAYWERDSPTWPAAIASADLVVGWGQGQSLAAVKHLLPHSIPFLEFGPKRSLAVVFADEGSMARAAMRIAYDVALYDQEACFSPQRVFVIGDHRTFVDELEKWLTHQQTFLPKGTAGPDADSHVLRTRLEAKLRGWEVRGSEAGFTIIVQPDPLATIEHPLGRTIFVHPVASLDDVRPFIDDETQTVAVYPFDKRAEDVANALCGRGAVRVCEVGLVAHPRQGFTHDGMYPLAQFVRLAYVDRPLDFAYKYAPPAELEQLERVLVGAIVPPEAAR